MKVSGTEKGAVVEGGEMFEVAGHVRVTARGTTLEEACIWFHRKYRQGAEEWERGEDGGTIHGFCEACARPLTDDTDYGTDPEGVQVCRECINEGAAE